MSQTVVAFVVAEALVLLVGALMARRPAGRVTALGRATTVLERRTDTAAERFPRWAVALVVVLGGWVVTLVAMFVLGKLAHALEPSVDIPMFAWARDNLHPGTWTSVWQVLTMMGNRRQLQTVVVVASVVLGVVWWRRGRSAWLPGVALVGGYLLEKFGQMIVKRLVDRGHPPTTKGTWPSGGCARLLVVAGVIALLVILLVAAEKRARVSVGLWTLVAVLAVAEAYSRTYLLKHWFTDVVGGLVYGVLLVAIVAAGVHVLQRHRAQLAPRGLAAGEGVRLERGVDRRVGSAGPVSSESGNAAE